MTRLETLKHELTQMLSLHYGCELYNHTENIDGLVLPGYVCLSFYHLNQVYNAMCSTYTGNIDLPRIDWQSHPVNKHAGILAREITITCNDMINHNESDKMLDIFKQFNERETAMYSVLYGRW